MKPSTPKKTAASKKVATKEPPPAKAKEDTPRREWPETPGERLHAVTSTVIMLADSLDEHYADIGNAVPNALRLLVRELDSIGDAVREAEEEEEHEVEAAE